MNVLQITVLHRFRGGCDVVATKTTELLLQRGHNCVLLTRDSRVLGKGVAGKIRAVAAGIYSRSGRRVVREALQTYRPDLVHVHDLYPFFSPWVLEDCRRAGIPVVMTCHDYRLTCPAATHLHAGKICEQCLGGREHWCFFKNCCGSRAQSLAYAARSIAARKQKLFLGNVAAYITPSAFTKERLAHGGVPEDRMVVIPNIVDAPAAGVDPSGNQYVAYVGRFGPEKGIETLLDGAGETGFPLRLAGDDSQIAGLRKRAPLNAVFLGPLEHARIRGLYQGARFLVFPSRWFETFGLVAAEAMSHGLPVIAANIGAIPEVVEDGVTGLLFEPGNARDLADKMKLLWNAPGLCRRMGEAARDKALREYSESSYYDRLLKLYGEVLSRCDGRGSVP